MLHIFLHLLVPAAICAIFFRSHWKTAYLFMMATMLVDIDHIFANPIYDPTRCSIGFHPLHRLSVIALYGCLCFVPKTRLVGIGLVIHMVLDSVDCQVTNGHWLHVYAGGL